MELILQTGLEHQEIPVKAVVDVFETEHFGKPNQYYENPILDFPNSLFKTYRITNYNVGKQRNEQKIFLYFCNERCITEEKYCWPC